MIADFVVERLFEVPAAARYYLKRTMFDRIREHPGALTMIQVRALWAELRGEARQRLDRYLEDWNRERVFRNGLDM